MKRELTKESASRLQKILSKRFDRQLNEQELEEAYHNLMEFAFALADLTPSQKPPVQTLLQSPIR